MTTTISGTGIVTQRLEATVDGLVPPYWTTAGRPANPFLGQTGWNTTLNASEVYVGAGSWQIRNDSTYTANYLVIAGGGSGGTAAGAWISAGGGGAGGYTESTVTMVTGGIYPVIVGAGGAPVYGNALGLNGGNSSLGGVATTLGGGGGGSGGNSGGRPGGSGGGASRAAYGAAGTAGQGYKGGDNLGENPYSGGAGGGGASAAGGNGEGAQGGAGIFSAINGTNTRRADGGPGAFGNNGNTGGVFTGAVNTGNGGGGYFNADPGAGSPSWSGAGGSGIVIIKYTGSQRGTGGVVTSVAGNTIHTFTASGTFTA